MTHNEVPSPTPAFYRVDRFSIPEAARAEFLERVAATHSMLRLQQGFIRDAVIEKASAPGVVDGVTVAEWESAEAIERAGAAVRKMHAETGFDRAGMFSRLGIKADIGIYRPVQR